MKKQLAILFLLVCASVGSVFATQPQTAELEGEWGNVDPRARGLTRLLISKVENGWAIEAWGKCHPIDCVWGTTVLDPLGSSVEDFSLKQGFAIWNAGFATKYVTLKLSKDRLTAETVTIFHDRSRRAHFRSMDAFQHAEVGPPGQRIKGVSKLNGIPDESSLSSKNSDLYEIKRLEIDWNRINEISSVEGKRLLLADDSYHVGPSGRTYTKAQGLPVIE